MKRKDIPAFTLIELLVVIAIIAILAAMLLPALHDLAKFFIEPGQIILFEPARLAKLRNVIRGSRARCDWQDGATGINSNAVT